MYIRQDSELKAVYNFGKAYVCLNVCACVTLHTADGIVIPLSVNMNICFFFFNKSVILVFDFEILLQLFGFEKSLITSCVSTFAAFCLQWPE